MNEIKKKIILDCLVTPFTVTAWLMGGTFLLLSAMLGSTTAFVGLSICMLGVGGAITNTVFNLDKISKKATKDWQETQHQNRSRMLDALEYKLVHHTPGKDDEIALQNLRALYDTFSADAEAQTFSVPVSLWGQIEEVFDTCVIQLEKSAEVYFQSMQMSGKLKKELQAQRKQMIEDVESSVEQLSGVVSEIRAMKWRANRGELMNLQQKLQSQLNVAKTIEERMVQLENGQMPTEDRYREYQT